MGRYTFVYDPQIPGEPKVGVEFIDTEHPDISHVVNAFRMFLLGITFQPSTIAKYVDVERVNSDLMNPTL